MFLGKKLYEWAIYLSIPFLVHGCIRFQDRGESLEAGACATALLAIAIWYYYFVKYRPYQVHRHVVPTIASAHGYAPLTTGSEAAVRRLRQFPGFDDTSVRVDTVHVRRDDRGSFYLGRYAIGGQSLHFGFFMLAEFRPTRPHPMSADVVKGHAYASDTEREPRVDPALVSTLLKLQFNWFVRGTTLLVDFDTREIRHKDFAAALTYAAGEIPHLGGFFESNSLHAGVTRQ
jgi:hypothetical protein